MLSLTSYQWKVQHHKRKMYFYSKRQRFGQGVDINLQQTRLVRQCYFRLVFVATSLCPRKFKLDSLKLCYLFLFSGIQNVAFFFSSISSQEKKRGCINDETDDESSSSDDVPSSITQQWLEGNLTSINKSLCPAISYWVALTTTNGAPASPISVHKALLNCGLDVTAIQVMIVFSFFEFSFRCI